jgi:hypothetical protein
LNRTRTESTPGQNYWNKVKPLIRIYRRAGGSSRNVRAARFNYPRARAQKCARLLLRDPRAYRRDAALRDSVPSGEGGGGGGSGGSSLERPGRITALVILDDGGSRVTIAGNEYRRIAIDSSPDGPRFGGMNVGKGQDARTRVYPDQMIPRFSRTRGPSRERVKGAL